MLLSRIPCVFMLGQQGHQTLLSELTPAGQERTNAFGRMGLINGEQILLSIFWFFTSFKFGRSWTYCDANLFHSGVEHVFGGCSCTGFCSALCAPLPCGWEFLSSNILPRSRLSFFSYHIFITFLLRSFYKTIALLKKEFESEKEANMCFSDAIGVLNRPGVLNVLFKKSAPLIPATFLFSVMQVWTFHEVVFLLFKIWAMK